MRGQRIIPPILVGSMYAFVVAGQSSGKRESPTRAEDNAFYSAT